ncbi:UBC13 [Hepatospora eriocheir]|uniref:UBC13 n=1 Tax=Hepatospora eriocheir TaxID=1081669 RepID=A0A1X0QDJ3_9MICR|nr:UBC13 [Hepatospora eriocheir]ORD99696.1 UBC13 [Hepatospora eriocheir]
MVHNEEKIELDKMAINRIKKELAMIKNDKHINIEVEICKDADGFEDIGRWIVTFVGSPDTPFQNYKLKGEIIFPKRYPIEPFSFRFLTKVWHPNIYPNGKVCLSTLESSDDPVISDYFSNCSWTPVNTVRTVCVSINLLLREPNIESPANVDASIQYRDDIDAFNKKALKYLEGSAEKINKN